MVSEEPSGSGDSWAAECETSVVLAPPWSESVVTPSAVHHIFMINFLEMLSCWTALMVKSAEALYLFLLGVYGRCVLTQLGGEWNSVAWAFLGTNGTSVGFSSVFSAKPFSSCIPKNEFSSFLGGMKIWMVCNLYLCNTRGGYFQPISTIFWCT